VKNIDKYLQVQKESYTNIFDELEHKNVINGVDVNLHFNYLKFNQNGNPKIDLLVETLFSYFTHYCFSAQKRDLDSSLEESEKERIRNKLLLEAKNLFREWDEKSGESTTGELGEMILWLFMEVLLKAPQVVAKMDLKTNPNLEVFGSDGIHIKIDEEILNIFFGEAKLYSDIYKALDSTFESIEAFHNKKISKHEYNLVTTHFKYLKDSHKDKIYKFITEQIDADEVKINHACLIGYDWEEYKKLDTSDRNQFILDFSNTYASDTTRLTKLIQSRFDKFSKKEFNFEVFFIPFKSVQEIRTAFNEVL
jgi:hypothetical protein